MCVYEKYKGMLSVEDRGYQGEVSTPLKLVNEMLDKLPEEVFINKSTTFLDPGFGNGTFLIEIVKRLRKQGHSMENIQERVYGCEISHRLYNKVTKLFSNYNFRKLYKEDFLTKDFNNMKFDVVIGNPPYQDNSKKNTSTSLWIPFLKKALDLSKGHVCFVNPINWLSLGMSKYKFLNEHNIKVAKIYDNENTPFPGVGIRVGYLLVQPNTAQSRIKFLLDNDSNMDMDISNRPNLPASISKHSLNIWSKLILSNSSLGINRKNQLHTQKKELWNKELNSEYPFKLYTSNDYIGCSVQRPEYNNTRVIIPEARSHKKALIITEGNTAQSVYTLEVSSLTEGKSALSFINSKVFDYLLSISKWGPANSQYTLENIPNIPLTKKWTDKEIYEHFNLTKEEIDLIESKVA